jgi:hypothetical protein
MMVEERDKAGAGALLSPPERNLSGISFAVANVTGLLAPERALE